MRHLHRHRHFVPALRGQRPALATVMAWLAVLAMLLAGLPALEHALPGAAAMTQQLPAEERTPREALQEEAPAKVRRAAAARVAAQPHPAPAPLADALDTLMATLDTLPPQRAPAVGSAPATPLPAAPGLRLQRGQAPPQG